MNVSGTTWYATGNADVYFWYDSDNAIVGQGNEYTPPAGANPFDYTISGANLISKKSSVYITGGDDYAQLDNSDFLNGATAFTIESWINISEYSTWDQLFTKRLTNTNRISIELANGYLFFEIGNGTNAYVYTNDAVIDDQWHHFAFVYNGNGNTNQEKIRVFLDGEALSLSYNGTIPSSTPVNEVPFTIGSPEANPEFEFTEVSLWSRALTADEINLHKNKQLGGNEEGLVYYFKTEEEGETLLNYADNSNDNATIVNYGELNRKNDYTGVLLYGCESEKWNVGEIATSISENDLSFPLSIIPNPNDGNFTISFDLPSAANAALKIFDMKGNLILTRDYHQATHVTEHLDAVSFSKGSFLLHVEAGKYKQQKKFIVR